MKLIKNPEEMHKFASNIRAKGKTIGLVPTMGYLHDGHLSLVEEAKRRSDVVVVSIFINPAQFGPGEDLKKYPKDLGRDKALLKSFDVDILFYPKVKDIYPEGFNTFVEVRGLPDKLCGRSRPAHFRGVTTIVAKLFNTVSPTYAFFGEKDYQQQLIIKRMVKDLDLPVEVVSLPIIREFDGLAMSSRNKYLSSKQRKSAASLYRALSFAKQGVEGGEKGSKKIISQMRSLIKKSHDVKIDYISIVDPQTLCDVKTIKGPVLIAVAAYIGKARLIDNILASAK